MKIYTYLIIFVYFGVLFLPLRKKMTNIANGMTYCLFLPNCGERQKNGRVRRVKKLDQLLNSAVAKVKRIRLGPWSLSVRYPCKKIKLINWIKNGLRKHVRLLLLYVILLINRYCFKLSTFQSYLSHQNLHIILLKV